MRWVIPHVFEPALLPINARQAHSEMSDIPFIDKGGYALLGNDDFFLDLIKKFSQSMINDYVAFILNASQSLGIKVVNPGGLMRLNSIKEHLMLMKNLNIMILLLEKL